jgi:anaphase-promoting complex subunit 7
MQLPNELDIKWRMYRCHVLLRQHQEALDTLSSIPLRLRNVQVAVALGNLYKNFKNDSRCAIICYRQALSMCPSAVEAMLGLQCLGISVSDGQQSIPTSSPKFNPHSYLHPPITSCQW